MAATWEIGAQVTSGKAESKDRSLRQLLQGERIPMQELPQAAIF